MTSIALIVSLVFVALAIVPAMSMDYMVGDDQMWTLDFDYVEWAKGKTFYVGDRLVFMYKQGDHNVIKVNGTQFKGCVVPDPNFGALLNSGNDIIPLATAGRKWFICGVGKHCLDHKMKLVIDVLPRMAPGSAPSPAPGPAPWTSTSAAGGIGPNFFAWLVSGALSIFMMIKA